MWDWLEKLIYGKNKTYSVNEYVDKNFSMKRLKLRSKNREAAFGIIRSAKYLHSNLNIEVKIEMEETNKRLQLEYNTYVRLSKSYSLYVPKVYAFGTVFIKKQEYPAMAMELLSDSTLKIFFKLDCKFSYKTVLMLFSMMLDRIEFLHDNDIVHCDIKPENFVFDINKDKMYLIDLGYHKFYRHENSKIHFHISRKTTLSGTPDFMSINEHMKISLSRRDDLESLMYIIIFFIKGSLPWMTFNKKLNEKNCARIAKFKENSHIEELCKKCPEIIKDLFMYIRNLYFEEIPDYNYIRSIIMSEMKKNEYIFDYKFDWVGDR